MSESIYQNEQYRDEATNVLKKVLGRKGQLDQNDLKAAFYGLRGNPQYGPLMRALRTESINPGSQTDAIKNIIFPPAAEKGEVFSPLPQVAEVPDIPPKMPSTSKLGWGGQEDPLYINELPKQKKGWAFMMDRDTAEPGWFKTGSSVDQLGPTSQRFLKERFPEGYDGLIQDNYHNFEVPSIADGKKLSSILQQQQIPPKFDAQGNPLKAESLNQEELQTLVNSGEGSPRLNDLVDKNKNLWTEEMSLSQDNPTRWNHLAPPTPKSEGAGASASLLSGGSSTLGKASSYLSKTFPYVYMMLYGKSIYDQANSQNKQENIQRLRV